LTAVVMFAPKYEGVGLKKLIPPGIFISVSPVRFQDHH
jgi:hypothetical protein